MSFHTPTIRKLSAGCGAEVLGVDLRKPSNSDMEIIRGAYRDYGVIFFRDQHLTPEDHIAFARRWGEIDINKFFPANGEYPEIAEVRKEKEQKTNIGGAWHTDHSYDPSPAMGSILVARELPEEGGDTLFSNMYAAYEALSDGLKETLSRLKAVHSNAMAFGAAGFYKNSDQGAAFKGESLIGQAVHPVVITHPLSGRKALYVNPAFTTHFEGWTPLESRPLLDFLYAHAVRPEFTCRFQWREGSVAFWDNRATWHYAANDYHGSKRLLHRITIGGVPLG
ncbi:MAG: TauD/TfdA family dioxygenase [Parvibaculum sp.]|uniref:TauD/TfdA dioxygenase family protein n=1 Tax=Parvibaculum sp. TaxID=2024848 RepID=UPI003C78E268